MRPSWLFGTLQKISRSGATAPREAQISVAPLRRCGRIPNRNTMKRVDHNPYDHELRVACELARAAGAAILEHYEGPLNIKQKNYENDLEPVTQADTIANELIVTGLKREFPSDGILAEESVDTKRRQIGRAHV